MTGRLAAHIAAPGTPAREIHIVRPSGLDAWLAALPAPIADYARAVGFTAAAGERPIPLPGETLSAALGIGDDRSHHAFGTLAHSLPQGDWALLPGDYDPSAAVLGFGLGAYRYRQFLASKAPTVRLLAPESTGEALALADSIWMVRDLINTPANALGPMELAAAAKAVAAEFGASFECIEGDALTQGYPAIAAVGAASPRPPCVAILRWQGSTAGQDAPLVSLCGKGVVFDTGGLDLKPSSAMLRMKKDMGGAAIMLGVARELMRQDLPIRVVLRLGCVENAVGGAAMRPGDVVRTRAGLSVEIGNTDAEGRLVLADLLYDAGNETPAVLFDCATLTGAARVATGPDLPALFCNDDTLADAVLTASRDVHDPVWRLPLWDGYDDWLKSPIADLNNVSNKPHAGAIVAALFLRRFVPADCRWAHFDAYAWNDTTRPARPEGGEAHAMRAMIATVTTRFVSKRVGSRK